MMTAALRVRCTGTPPTDTSRLRVSYRKVPNSRSVFTVLPRARWISASRRASTSSSAKGLVR